MLPGDGTLIDPSLHSDFLWPMRSQSDLLTDYEMGGMQFQHADGALDAQLWTLTYADPDVKLTSENGADITLFSRSGITELALAFDQNMNAFVAFVENGQAKFWWYDTTTSAMTFSDLPADAVTPRSCLDDHTRAFRDTSDIILAYVRDGDLYYRQQRDRYATEYLLRTSAGTKLAAIGMNKGLRLQFQLG